MNNSNKAVEPDQKPELLKECLQHILAHTPLDTQRTLVQSLADDLGIDLLSCAAALFYLTQPQPAAPAPTPEPVNIIKMVRYRLDVGSQHQVNAETLKKVLVEESGVDKNNINNINIRGLYTLIDLPDSMPPDIFQHLKTVEINARPLAIKRVKSRYKKRTNLHRRRSKPHPVKSGKAAGDPCAD
ncbi:DbpA RNA binding domain-containing protein [Methylovulum miyakonense]|uniref:DbpA RNA binding domain-containing protein n=1 Tax=Methylovulum miyakonense TaxID=645578 RepID=UPI0003640DE7|nr:DbpA RNA binding domain-containing protein [Methylovulum miyakonense]